MFIDASAIIAVLAEEASAGDVIAALEQGRGGFSTSPLCVFEATLGLARARTPAGVKPGAAQIETALEAVEEFLVALDARELDITPATARRAIAAARTYGKAVGHPADLNFGDCFVYALAKEQKTPLLFVGGDFTRTDISSAIPVKD